MAVGTATKARGRDIDWAYGRIARIFRWLAATAVAVRRRDRAPSIDARGGLSPGITTRIMQLVAVAVLPLLGFTGFLIVHDAEGNRAGQLQQFQDTTHVMSLAIDAEIERQLAIALTLRNALESKDLDLLDFHNLALATAADVPDVRIYLYDRSGRMLTTSTLPFGSELPPATAPEVIHRVVDSGLPYVSDLITGPVSKVLVTQVFVPVIADGVVTSVVAIGYPPSRISRVVRERTVTQGGIGVVFDRTGRIIARTRNEDEYQGQFVVPDLMTAAGASQEGVFVTNTLEGIPIRGIFIRSSISGWTTALAIPWGEVNAPLVNTLMLLGGGGTVFIAAVLVITAYYARGLARPLILLSEMAVALGRGESLAYRHFDIREVQETADRLCGAADELHQRNAALLRQTNALDVANRELEGFSYATSHVLRAPLRAIDGFSAILLEEHSSGLDSEGKRLIGVLRASSLEINEQIDGIIEFLRLNRQAMVPGRIRMADLAQVALKKLEPATRGRRLKIKLTPLPDAYGDAAMMERVWGSLLDNAVKFTVHSNDAEITVGSMADQGNTAYYVRDNGVGFDMQFADKLFGVFNRLHGADFTGNGMGLAIVNRIVARHGGRVWAAAGPGEGATFYFSLPVAENIHV